MKTFKRICIKSETFQDGGKTFSLIRGKEYITSDESNGEVTVFSNYWVRVPVELFAGSEVFTKVESNE